MLRIRLRRMGKTKAPTYRVVIADSRAPRNGKFIETIGHYNPRTKQGYDQTTWHVGDAERPARKKIAIRMH